MTKDWDKIESAISDTLGKTFISLEALMNLGIIFSELPNDDRSLLVERLIEKGLGQEIDKIGELIIKADEPLQQLLQLMAEIGQRKRESGN